MKRKRFTKIIYVKLNGIHYKPKFAKFVSRQKTRLNGNFSIVNTLDGKNHWQNAVDYKCVGCFFPNTIVIIHSDK